VVIAHGTFNAVLGVLAGAAVAENPTLAAYLTGERTPPCWERTPPSCAGVI
jgi:hypothetical protein